MEHDYGNPGTLRGLVQSQAIAGLLGNINSPLATRIQKLVQDVTDACKTPSSGTLDTDEHIGTRLLPLTATDLLMPTLGPRERKLTFKGEDAEYEVFVEITGTWGQAS